MYPYQRTPMGNPYIIPINTMGTLLGDNCPLTSSAKRKPIICSAANSSLFQAGKGWFKLFDMGRLSAKLNHLR